MTEIKDRYKTISGRISFEFEEERSRFISDASYVESEEEAINFIEEIRKSYPDANHHCYAYFLNKLPEIKRYSDDGEPQGSAGLPMLSVLEKEEAKDIVVVTTRYFGGKKLGKGGLVRVYTRSVSDCIAPKLVYKSPFYRVKLTHAYNLLGQIENFLNEKKYRIINKEFEDLVKIELYIGKEEFNKFQTRLIDMTSANIRIEKIKVEMLYED